MSPEQVVGRELDSRTDIFTLGIVLAELLIRRPLFGGGEDPTCSFAFATQTCPPSIGPRVD